MYSYEVKKPTCVSSGLTLKQPFLSGLTAADRVARVDNAPRPLETSAPGPSRRLRSWLPVVVWAALIFAASSIPGSRLPKMHTSFDDKVEHAIVYGILGALCWRALRRTTPLGPGQAAALATLIALGYGITDEVHQLFVPQRSFELLDMAADASGAALGAAVASLSAKLWKRGAPS